MSVGAPSDYTPEIADKVCILISTSTLGLKHICNKDGVPDKSTIYRWLAAHPEFRDKYARAKELQAELMGEEILEIADDDKNDVIAGPMGESGNATAVNRARLRVDARKWLMAKMLPKKYGDKIEQTHIGDANNPIVTEHKVTFHDYGDTEPEV